VQLREDRTYNAAPLSSQTCMYCPIRNVCLKAGDDTQEGEEDEIA